MDRYISQDSGADLEKLTVAYNARVTREAPIKEKYDQEVAAARAARLPIPPQPQPRLAGPFRGPSHLYDGMIAPLENYTVQGIAWYQGESNGGGSSEATKQSYRPMLIDLIRLWAFQVE